MEHDSANPSLLSQTYGLSCEKVNAHYADWASTYEQELLDNGYVTPGRCAAALAGCVADRSQPVLDIGCGTGLSGLALRSAGFEVVDGIDFSAPMLAYAAQKPSLYRQLMQIDLNYPLDIAVGSYAQACAAGVISPGHAPPATIAEVLHRLAEGGCFVLSLNDHALAEVEFPRAVDAVIANGSAELLVDEYGDHITGIGLRSRVCVLRKV